jgi:hypothetical protein
MYLGPELTLGEVFALCRQKYIPEGCRLFELRADGDIEIWPAGDNGIIKGSNFEDEAGGSSPS